MLKALGDLTCYDPEKIMEMTTFICPNQTMNMVPLNRELLYFDEELDGVLFYNFMNQRKACIGPQAFMTKPGSIYFKYDMK